MEIDIEAEPEPDDTVEIPLVDLAEQIGEKLKAKVTQFADNDPQQLRAALETLNKRIDKADTMALLVGFCHRQGEPAVPLRHSANSKIRVQSTAIMRRSSN